MLIILLPRKNCGAVRSRSSCV